MKHRIFKPIDENDYKYGDDFILYFHEHPKLYGKWEIYYSNKEGKEIFVDRAANLKEAENHIINFVKKNNIK